MDSSPLPREIAPLFSCPLVPVDIGRSEAQVFESGDLFLKIAPAGSLKRAADMTAYFAAKNLTTPPAAYVTQSGKDYFVTRRVPGKSGLAYLDRPDHLVEMFARCARRLHDLPHADCPYGEKGGEVLLHGDLCLPNVFFDEHGFTGFVDLGEAGAGDRHHDLYWALWTLNYNLGTDAYNDRFLDIYGRDLYDESRMQACRDLYERDE